MADQNSVDAIVQAQKDAGVGTYKEQDDTTRTEYEKNTGTGYEKELLSVDDVNSGQLKNTGSGMEAAEGVQYSWEKKATEKADNQYQQDVLKVKQEKLQNRQKIQEQAEQYQTTADMQQYASNQSIDKVGWTGGYVLDSIRQQEYLKQSIDSQIFNAMELQKYGYDTALQAARVAYDMNQKEYALELYKQAQQTAFNEYEVSGNYLSAEAREHLGAHASLSETLSKLKQEGKEDTQEYLDTEKKLKAATQWFVNYGVSPEGITAATNIDRHNSLIIQQASDAWQRYYAFYQANSADSKVSDVNSGVCFKLDSDGNVLDGTTVDFNDMTSQEFKDYITDNNYATTQFKSFIGAKAKDAAEEYLESLKNGDGKYTLVDFEATAKEKINEIVNEIYTKLGITDEDSIKKDLTTIINNEVTAAKKTYDANKMKAQADWTTDTSSMWNQKNGYTTTYGEYVLNNLIGSGAKTADLNGKSQSEIEAILRNLSNDVDANKEGDNGYVLLTNYAKAIASNEIPNGSIIKLNYGTDSKDIDYYLYLNRELTQLKNDTSGRGKAIYGEGGLVKLPGGYKLNSYRNVTLQ